MVLNDRIKAVESALQKLSIPGWLFYGLQRVDPLALRILGFPDSVNPSRRWFYLVTAKGAPQKLVHHIESSQLDHLPGTKNTYLRWQELRSELVRMLKRVGKVAMQYSENCRTPYVSKVDAGTIELVRDMGVEVVSSADLVQLFEAVLSPKEVEEQVVTARTLTEIVNQSYGEIAETIQKGFSICEYDVQQSILRSFERHDLVSDHPPMVAVNNHSGDPHYNPPHEGSERIRRGDFLLIDLWARPNKPTSVYADITWNGFFGPKIPAPIQKTFEIIRKARDVGVEFLNSCLLVGRKVQGWEVDDQVRGVIEKAGFGEFFVHRSGHNIGREVHGNGVNFDNIESHDTRTVIPGILCSIEPGIYLENFGVRTEINIFVHERKVVVTTPPQNQVLTFDI